MIIGSLFILSEIETGIFDDLDVTVGLASDLIVFQCSRKCLKS